MLRALARLVYRFLLPQRAKSTLGLYLLLDERDKFPEAIEEYTADDVLVLAPHMDDEVIGCGGAVRKHVLAGARVTVIFLTDGRKGNTSLYEDSGRTPGDIAAAEENHSVERKQESKRAAAILGVQETIFLDGPDNELDATPDLVRRIGEIIVAHAPQVIYVPSMLEVHPDHWAANRVLYRVLVSQPRNLVARCILREYEAWTPLLPNRLADITDVFDAKIEALREFRSQLAHVDYVRATRGLNSYRSIYRNRGAGYAEAFFESTPVQYAALYERFERTR